MLTSLSSKAIMTKAKAMYSHHLTADQYQEMLQMKNVPEIAAYLKDETVYGEVLTGIQPASIHRGQLESQLRKMRYGQYARLMRFDTEISDSYYRHLLEEAEIEQILDMLRLMNAGTPEEFVTRYPVFLEHGARFSLAALAKAQSFGDLLEVLEKTPYAQALRSCAPGPTENNIDFTACETALLTGYYQRLEQVISRLFRGRVRTQLQELMQTRMELTNIARIYRVKKLLPETGAQELRGMLLPSWRRIGGSDLEQFLQAGTAGDFLSLLEQSRYAQYFGEGQNDFLFIEYRTDCIEYRLAKRYLHFASDAPTAFTAFMILSELELENIVTVIEGIRYGVSREETASMLVL